MHEALYRRKKRALHPQQAVPGGPGAGEVLRIRENEYLYSGFFFDTNEMLSWVKTFTGRVMDIQCSNQAAVSKVTGDWERMYHMYCDTDTEIPEKNISEEPDDRERK